jgi:hypothetical protein
VFQNELFALPLEQGVRRKKICGCRQNRLFFPAALVLVTLFIPRLSVGAF